MERALAAWVWRSTFRHGRIADDNRDAEPPGRRHELAVRRALDDDDPLLAANQFLGDAKTDVAQAADDNMAAVRDAAYFQRRAKPARIR